MDKEFELRIQGYHMTMAEVVYHLPDHPHILQSFIWQTLDKAPKFPRIQRFLGYWVMNIDGVLHSVRLSHAELVQPQEIFFAKAHYKLH